MGEVTYDRPDMCCYGDSILGDAARVVNPLDCTSAVGSTCCTGNCLVVVLCVERAWRVVNCPVPDHEHVAESAICKDAETKNNRARRWQLNHNLVLARKL